MKNKKLLKYLGIATAILLIFVIVGKSMGWIGKKDIIKISTELCLKRTITETVSANGKVQPVIEVKISPDVSGEIVDLYIKEGDEVKKGDLLAKINPDFYISNLDRMNAALNSSKANLANAKARLAQVQAQFENAKLSYDRNVKLWGQQAISASEFDNAKSAFEVAKAEVDASLQNVASAEYSVKSGEASLKEAKDNLVKTSIFAAMTGTISKLSVEKGERVVGTSQFAGTEILRIANLNEMEVRVNVSENDIVRVNMNDTSIIDIDAYPEKKFKGIVTSIANSASTSGISADQVTNFEVKIKILASSYKDLLENKPLNYSPFRPGMSATVDIRTKTAFNQLTVPIQSVTTRMDSTKIKEKLALSKAMNKTEDNNKPQTDKEEIIEYVFIYKDGTAKQTKVKTGIQDNNYIVITEGIKENDEVIAAPYRAISKRLKDGDNVTKVDKKDLFNSNDENN